MSDTTLAMQVLNPFLAGILNGFLHVVLGPDHIAVVIAMAQFTKPSEAFLAGCHWAISHSIGLGLIGVVFAVMRSAGAAEDMTEWI